MKRKIFMRCIASLMSLIYLCGIVCPTEIFAAETATPLNAMYSYTLTERNDVVPNSKHPYKMITITNTTTNGVSRVYFLTENQVKKLAKVSSLIRVENETVYFGVMPNATDDTKDDSLTWKDIEEFSYTFSTAAVDGVTEGDAYSSYVLHSLDPSYSQNDGTVSYDSVLLGLNDDAGAPTADISNLCQRMASHLLHYMYMFESDDGYGFYDNKGTPLYKEVTDITDSAFQTLLTMSSNLELPSSMYQEFSKAGLVTARPSNATSKDYLPVSPYTDANISNLGVLVLKPGLGNGGSKIDNTHRCSVEILNTIAAYTCITEYVHFYNEEFPGLVTEDAWNSNQDTLARLFYIKKFHDTFSPFIPAVEKVYHTKNASANDMSMAEAVEYVSASIEDMNFAKAKVSLRTHVSTVKDTTSPMTMFYKINSDTGIVSYNRDAILGDASIDGAYDRHLKDVLETKHQLLMNTGSGDLSVFEAFSVEQVPLLRYLIALLNYDEVRDNRGNYDAATDYNDYVEEYYDEHRDELLEPLSKLIHEGEVSIVQENGETVTKKSLNYNKIMKSIQTIDAELFDKYSNWDSQPEKLYNLVTSSKVLETFYVMADISTNPNWLLEAEEAIATPVSEVGVDENGVALNYGAVTMTDFITRGLGYSTTYIPMQTNLYSADTISSFKKSLNKSLLGSDDFFDMYLKFGFLRKAVYIETSASAVQDYYNAGGTTTGTLRVATLRDLIESGNKEVALYIDSSVYNKDTLLSEGNTVLSDLLEQKTGLLKALIAYNNVLTMSKSIKSDVTLLVEYTEGTCLSSVVNDCVNDDAFDLAVFKASANDCIMRTYGYNVNALDTNTGKSKSITEQIAATAAGIAGGVPAGVASSLDNGSKKSELQQAIINMNRDALISSKSNQLTDATIKTAEYTSYDPSVRKTLDTVSDASYRNVNSLSFSSDGLNAFSTSLISKTRDNTDCVVLPSYNINKYIAGKVKYAVTQDNGGVSVTKEYTMDANYTPMMSLAFISLIYRDSNYFTLANTVESNNPIFLASDKMCGIAEANQWYRNTLLNYMLMKNLAGNAQLDVSYISDLDCPLYCDIFGNILTESGTVVIPAACNATLHTGAFRNFNFGAGLFTCYGSEYYVPADLPGAGSVIYPYFVADTKAGYYVINGYELQVNGTAIRFDKLDTYDDATRKSLSAAYLTYVTTETMTRLNWMAMVKICNEVLRGAPIENIDKDAEGLSGLLTPGNTAGLVAAAKFESMLDSLRGNVSNSLLKIPDFSRIDSLEIFVALFIKLLMVATAGVVIISIYRDGVAGTLGFRTILQSLAAVALTVLCVVGIPSIFQLTYYSANRALLQNEAFRILLANEEKRQGGEEIGITKVDTIDSSGEFALQLDWITVPWYEELENILYSSTLENLQAVRLKAYRETPTYDKPDVTVYNDGVYVTTDTLFDSVEVDYNFTAVGAQRGLRLVDKGIGQTTSFYSPYYVFLQALTANVNEYNAWRGTMGDTHSTQDAANDAAQQQGHALSSYNFTTKYMSGNRLKTVGASKAYFESELFMNNEDDILRLNQIYCANTPVTDVAPDEPTTDTEVTGYLADTTAQEYIRDLEAGNIRTMTFSDENRLQFRGSYWFNHNVIYVDKRYMEGLDETGMTPEQVAETRNEVLQPLLVDYYNRVEKMDVYARDFVARNKDLLGKVTDETFLKVMALAMAVKYNQLFGVPSANSIEIFNMASEDLMRLCVVPTEEAVMASTMSYPRFVYTFGGEAAVYLAAILSIILWIGSYIKPLCTVIIFVSVFVSIFVFRVVLRRKSANLWGYFVTVCLLCLTNILHALVLKVGVSLPNFGLPPVACFLFMIILQVVYLLILAYVTGVSLKDWANLGANEYAREAKLLTNKFRKDSKGDLLSGAVKHHDNNWDYYNDLVDQHRKRNT